MSTMNLLPEDYIQRRRTRRSNLLCLGLFVLILAGVVTSILLSQRTCNNTQKVLDRVNGEFQEATKLIAQLQELEAQKRTMIQKAETTASLLERVPRSYLLAVVTQSLPQTATISNFELYPKRIIIPADRSRIKDAKFAAKAVKDDEMTIVQLQITGLAGTDVDVARFIASLSRHPLSSAVDLIYSQEKPIELKDADGNVTDKQIFREFQVRVDLRSDVDVIDVIKDPTAQAAIEEPAQTASGARS